MDDCAVKRLGLILAIQSEIEGMKAHNKARELSGDSLAYGDADFCSCAEQIRIIINKHNDEL